MITMPIVAKLFGKSENTKNPITVAMGISRYCIGANMVDGAKRNDHVINKCANVPRQPMASKRTYSNVVGTLKTSAVTLLF